MKVVRALGAVLCLGLVVAVALSVVPTWWLSLLEHFRVHMAVASVPLALGAAVLGHRWVAGAMVLVVVALAINVRVWQWFGGAPIATGQKPARVLIFNVHRSNDDHARTARLIADTQPDLIALVEVTDAWLVDLAPALADYPSRVIAPRSDGAIGLALFAKSPARVAGQVVTWGAGTPSLLATWQLEPAEPATNTVTLAMIHPFPPMDDHLWRRQQRQFADMVAALRGIDPLIVLGDFNATPWSRAFLKVQEGLGLCDTRVGFGLHATFPAQGATVGIPIDHALVSCTIGVSRRVVLPDVGSDHRPILLELQLP